MVETSGPAVGVCCRRSGRRQRSEAGARIPRVGGRCRNVARVISHRFGLWAVDRLSEPYTPFADPHRPEGAEVRS